MDPGAHNRQVPLSCPTCGSSQFKVSEAEAAPVECARCGRSLTREQLIGENTENISAHVEEVKAQVTEEVRRDLKDMLRKAFSGDKNIRIG